MLCIHTGDNKLLQFFTFDHFRSTISLKCVLQLPESVSEYFRLGQSRKGLRGKPIRCRENSSKKTFHTLWTNVCRIAVAVATADGFDPTEPPRLPTIFACGIPDFIETNYYLFYAGRTWGKRICCEVLYNLSILLFRGRNFNSSRLL